MKISELISKLEGAKKNVWRFATYNLGWFCL